MGVFDDVKLVIDGLCVKWKIHFDVKSVSLPIPAYLSPMANLLLIVLCLSLGFILRRSGQLPAQGHVALNQYVLWLAIPALALYHIPGIRLHSGLLLPVATAWIIFGLSWLFFGSLGRWLQWPRKLTGALILTAGLGNTAFVGFPLIEAFYGKSGLELAVLVDQPGTFLAVSSIGVVVAAQYAHRKKSSGGILSGLLRFPPFVGFSVALLLNLMDLPLPTWLSDVFLTLSHTITPVAMVSVGMQLRFDVQARYWNFVALGLAFKLVLAPLFILLFYYFVFNPEPLTLRVCTLEAAMAPMVTAAILAQSYGLKPRFSSLILSVGIPLSLLSVYLWYILLTWVFL